MYAKGLVNRLPRPRHIYINTRSHMMAASLVLSTADEVLYVKAYQGMRIRKKKNPATACSRNINTNYVLLLL